ncbi:MAG: tetratricopeptide repeat protein [Verrucomicrobiota bacterium]
MNSSTRQAWVISCLLGLAVLAAFWPAFGCGFVNYDDPFYVTGNWHVRGGLNWPGVRWALTATDGANWNPVTFMSHSLDCQLYGLNPAGHHLTSVLLHLANSALLWLLLRRMTGAPWRSALAAALFALHPLRVESVVWISERKDVLSAFFGLLTAWAYVRYAENFKSQISNFKFYYAAALVLFAVGLMAKPMLVTLPFVFLLLDYWPLDRFRLGWRLVLEKVPFFLLAIGSSVVTFLVQERTGAMASLARFPLGERLGNVPLAYAGYLSKDFWPAELASFYPHEPLRAGPVVGAPLLLGAVTALAVWRGRSRPYLAVGWFWFLGMLVPTIGLVQVGAQLMADRYTYLPCVGLWIMVAWGMHDLAAWRPALRESMILAGAAAVAVCVVLTSRHAEIYRDSGTLWEATLRVCPESLIAHNDLSKWLIEKGRLNEARAHCRQALALRPDDPEAELNLAEICLREGNADEAVAQCLKSIAAQPRSEESYDALARAYLKKGRMDQAIAAFEKALEIKPDFPQAWCNLGFALLQQRRLPEAVRAYQKSLELNPDYALAQNDLGGILRQMGRTDEAMEHFRRAMELEPDFGEAHYNAAEILLQQGRTNEALAEYQKALASLPDLAPAKSRVAEILRRQGGNGGR